MNSLNSLRNMTLRWNGPQKRGTDVRSDAHKHLQMSAHILHDFPAKFGILRKKVLAAQRNKRLLDAMADVDRTLRVRLMTLRRDKSHVRQLRDEWIRDLLSDPPTLRHVLKGIDDAALISTLRTELNARMLHQALRHPYINAIARTYVTRKSPSPPPGSPKRRTPSPPAPAPPSPPPRAITPPLPPYFPSTITPHNAKMRFLKLSKLWHPNKILGVHRRPATAVNTARYQNILSAYDAYKRTM